MKTICSVLIAAIALTSLGADESASPIYLWPNGAPGFESRAQEKEVVTIRGEPDISFPVTANIHNPSIAPYLAAGGTTPRPAVIIGPGGGHRFLTMDREGYDLAKWLSERGVAAFVLKYRLARETNSPYRIETHALADAQRAIRLIRSRAKEWNINPNAVGVLGFSAGGEVAALASMKFDEGDAASTDPIEKMRCRPDFQALIYPGNSRGIVVSSNSPPAFLACASDDRSDISRGLAEVYLKFKEAQIPVELHIYTKGGHGFGVRVRPLAVTGWPARFHEWLMDLDFVERSRK